MSVPAPSSYTSAYTPGALLGLHDQPRVRAFLSAACTEGQLSHAYLFLGAPGAGMYEAARALAQVVVCPHGGDGSCEECVRVQRGTHPDVHVLAPAGVAGYLVDQVRGLLEDVSLAPVRARSKVYVLKDADRLRGVCANALLKTIEEPPEGVMFILLARTVDAMLPTIVSRCQQVPFRVLPDSVAVRTVREATGADESEARAALSVAGSPESAVDFLSSASRRALRREVVRTLGELAHDDAWDVLVGANGLVEAVQTGAGLVQDGKRRKREEVVKDEVEARTKNLEDYYSASALKQVEESVKRELTARERSGIMEIIAASESLLRDVLVRLEHVDAQVVNADAADVVDRLARTGSVAGVLKALEATSAAARDVARNVTPQLALEVMLLSIKEALVWQ